MEKPASTKAPNPYALNAHHFVYAQRGSARAGFVDQFADQCLLADVIADATRDCLIEHAGRLVIVREGKTVDASVEPLQALIAERVEVQKLVNGELVYSPCVLSSGQVRALLLADSYKTGSLAARVMKA